ncbi:uncharacterized protein B0P05DRAFT_554631, partial [Gilbertella persicaria]|uniref:uncharacterized protein n=1 Tax=Gilbertella persicaria TaxID=101096 RepID=UPI002220C4F5
LTDFLCVLTFSLILYLFSLHLTTAFSIALKQGISLDDIQTLGNWVDSKTFQNHYRQEHLSTVDFTNQVLGVDLPMVQLDEGSNNDEENQEFFDATEGFWCFLRWSSNLCLLFYFHHL